MLSNLCCASNNKVCNCFYSFCFFEIFFLSNGARARTTLLPASIPGGLTARIPGFHPSYSGPIPGQGTEILPQDYSLLSLQGLKEELKSLEPALCVKTELYFLAITLLNIYLAPVLFQGQYYARCSKIIYWNSS